MLILQRHLLRQVVHSSGMVLAVLLLVVLSLFLAELLAESASGRWPVAAVWWLLLLRLPEALLLVGPLALMLGVLLGLGQLQEQHELSVMRAAGWPAQRALAVVGLWVLSAAMALWMVSAWFAPWAAQRGHSLMLDAAQYALVAALAPGQFDSLDQGRTMVYVGEVDLSSQGLSEVMVQRTEGDQQMWLTARRGLLWVDPEDQSRYLSVFAGEQIEHDRHLAQSPLRWMQFERNDIRLPASQDGGAPPEMRQSLWQLWGGQDPVQRREWHWRWSAPVAALSLGLLAMPLAMRPPRQGPYGGVLLALAVYLIYSSLIHAGLLRMEQLAASSGPGLWPMHAVVWLAVVGLCWRQWRRW